ncbi:aspartate/glutamate racemase family protein [Synergistaceae bacterium OttesenSCG-928-D05]|nr:aspartate/glutamate racemase family protein [Synergistaceae bacterium OttesenSCG-928-D05]
MPFYKVKSKSRSWDGEPIGILILDAAYPCVPGNVGNATTYPFPVRYHEVRGASIERLLNQRDPTLLEPFLEGARKLEAEGVRGITGACGFMALFQPQIADAVDVPVFMSSLLQVPFITRTLKKGQKVGVLTANASVLTEEHMRNVGITPDMPVVVYGMEEKYEFRSSILEEKGTMDTDIMEKEILEVCDKMLAEHPDVAAIQLECSDMPPFARAVHEHTGRPVFDFITMIRHVYSALEPTLYSGPGYHM